MFPASRHVMLEVRHSIFGETPGREGNWCHRHLEMCLRVYVYLLYVYVCRRARVRVTINSSVTRCRQDARM